MTGKKRNDKTGIFVLPTDVGAEESVICWFGAKGGCGRWVLLPTSCIPMAIGRRERGLFVCLRLGAFLREVGAFFLEGAAFWGEVDVVAMGVGAFLREVGTCVVEVAGFALEVATFFGEQVTL